ncbi:MAG: HAD-IA family hydrolase [Rubrimonas sp.]
MRTVVFDLDGTLADTAPDLIGAANAVGAARGWPPLDALAERRVAGQGGRALLRRAIALAGIAHDETLVDAALPDFLALYEARIARETRLFPGAAETLEGLGAAGWRLAICTNKPQGLAERLLDALGVAHRFAAVLGADAARPRKPDPAHLLETIALAGGDPRRAVLVGDTATDRETARAAGAPCILCEFGYALEPLARLAPDAVIADLRQTGSVAARLLGEPP